MNPSDPHNPDPRSLASAGERGCPSEMDLATWLDGHADEALAERIVVHLASCPACLDAARASGFPSAAPDEGLVFVPQHVINAAMGLVSEPVIAAIVPRNAAVWFTFGRRSAAAAAVVAIGVLGHHVGASLSSANSASGSAHASTQAAASDPLSFGLLDEPAEAATAVDLLQAVLSTEAVQ